MSVGFPYNKGADQPAHLRSLIHTFVIRVVEGIIYEYLCTNSLYSQLVHVCNAPVSLKLKEIGTSWGVARKWPKS